MGRAEWERRWEQTPAEHFVWYRSPLDPEIEEAIRERAQLPRGAAIDVGCGIGQVAAALTPTFAPAVGFDIAFAAVADGRRRFADQPLGVADACRIPVADGSAALVVSRGLLHQMPTSVPGPHLDEIARVLAPGGRLFLTARRRWHTPADARGRLRNLVRMPKRVVQQRRNPMRRTLNSRRRLARAVPPTLRIDKLDHRRETGDTGTGLPQVCLVATRVGEVNTRPD